MDRRPIGVFDSGLGGLTAVRELARIMPEEDLIYFGDTSRVPYGGRSRETLVRYALQDAAFLGSFGPKAIVVACGTVSSNAMEELRAACAVPVYGVVEPAAQAAVRTTRSGRVGVIGTEASIRSDAYARAVRRLCPGAEVLSVPCPLLVPLVENGRYQAEDGVVETVLEEYLAPLRIAGVDTLVLGCTHYPLLRGAIAAVMGPEVALVDVGEECARTVAEDLSRQGLRAERTGPGSHRFYVSDSTGAFGRLATIFLGEDATGAEQVDITAY